MDNSAVRSVACVLIRSEREASIPVNLADVTGDLTRLRTVCSISTFSIPGRLSSTNSLVGFWL
ncbi:MAG: hypothetical protein Q4P71_01145 [Actinomycetaceae bacterium]|nr:hypothetical protein [Actinomycetaceae bacterium]